MAFRYRNIRQLSAVLPPLFSGFRCHECGLAAKMLVSSLIPLACTVENIVANGACRPEHASRFSTVAARSNEISSEVDLLSFIRSTFDDAEGPYHRWLNRSLNKDSLKKNGAYLIIAEAFLDDSPRSRDDRFTMLEKVKLLQQRYPWLYVFGIQSCSISSKADLNNLMGIVMEEYISFPVLLCSKIFPKVASGGCCILSKGLENQPLYNEKDVDLSILSKAIKDLHEQLLQNAGNIDKLKSPWSKQTECSKEPYIFSYFQSFPLLFPACISGDESGKTLFLSDSNHHRVIVLDRSGKILDMIGSSPGFEDGDFETAKLMRPAASYYHASEHCLYLVDSENHAIRRADLGRRVLETLSPSCDGRGGGGGGLWAWILDKLGFRRKVDSKSVEFNEASLLFPWHLIVSEDNNLLVMNRSFQTLWVVDLNNGIVREVVKGAGNIMEFCGEQIMEKLVDLQGYSTDHLEQAAHCNHQLGGILYSAYMSSFVTSGEDMLICDTVGQRVLMLNKQAAVAASVEFSNFGALGLAYWLSSSLEKIFPSGHTHEEAHFDHVQSFALFPGRTDVHLTVDIPSNTELVEPLQEHCIWRQARGSAMEVLGVKSTAATTEKVGVAQQWYDELDNLPYEEEPEISKEEDQTSHRDLHDGKIHIDCVVNTSPGTSEVIVTAPLYLKLKSSSEACKDNQDKKATEIAEILKPGRSRGMEREILAQLLLNLNRDLENFVFMKPLLVKITFSTLNHPKTENSRDIILTDSTVDVNVSM